MTESETDIIQKKLENYANYALFIASAKAAKPKDEGDGAEEPFILGEAIRELERTKSFILSLPDSREKLMLYYHYIRGMSMERVAELLGISTRSIYRVRVRALKIAAEIYSAAG